MKKDSLKNRRKPALAGIQNQLLELLASSQSRKDYLESVVRLIKEQSGCECVGIRILDENGNIPYDSYSGFSADFWQKENQLSLHGDQCACVRIARGKADPQDKAAITDGGSFFRENIADFVASLSPTEVSRYRGECVREGFLTMALIPIKHQEKIIGLVHLADKRPSILDEEDIRDLETASPLIGESIHKFDLSDNLKKNYDLQKVMNTLLDLALKDISLSKILKKALDMILSISWLAFGSTGSIFLTRNNTKTLEMEVQKGIEPYLLKKCRRVRFGECLCGLAAQDKKIVFAGNLDTRHVLSSSKERPHGHYCVPMLDAGKVLGVINVYLKAGHIRNRREEEFLKAVSNTLTGIIKRKRIDEERKKAEAERLQAENQLLESYKHLGAINRRLSILFDLGAINNRNDEKEVLSHIENSALNLSQAKAVRIFRYKKETSELEAVICSEKGSQITENRAGFSVSVNSHAFLKPLFEKKIRVQGVFKNNIHDKLTSRNQRIKYFLLLPILADKKVLGAIFFGFSDRKDITTQELDFYEAFASQASRVLKDLDIFKKKRSQ